MSHYEKQHELWLKKHGPATRSPKPSVPKASMKITFDNHSFPVRICNGLYSLKDIEQGWKNSGGTGKALRHWKDSVVTKELLQLSEIRIINSRGADGGTWGCEDAVLEYAMHCSVPFRAAVRNTFKAAARGNGEKAVEIAQSVVNIKSALKPNKKLALVLRRFMVNDPVTFVRKVLEQSKALSDIEFDKLIKTLEGILTTDYITHYAVLSAMHELKHRKADRYSRAAKLRA